MRPEFPANSLRTLIGRAGPGEPGDLNVSGRSGVSEVDYTYVLTPIVALLQMRNSSEQTNSIRQFKSYIFPQGAFGKYLFGTHNPRVLTSSVETSDSSS
jgi:hypothetical protein